MVWKIQLPSRRWQAKTNFIMFSCLNWTNSRDLVWNFVARPAKNSQWQTCKWQSCTSDLDNWFDDFNRPGHMKFLFSGQKIWNFRTFFRTPESQKRVFLSFRVHITSERRLSSERKMIDLEWPLHAILILKSGTMLLCLCPVLLTHK